MNSATTTQKRRRGGGPSLSRWTRPLRDALTIPLIECLRWACVHLPHGACLTVGRGLGWLGWLFAPGLRSRALQHLEMAGIGESGAERSRIVRRMFQNLSMNVAEWLHSMGWEAEEFATKIEVQGIDNLRAVSSRGFVIVTGHIGNWELIPRAYLAQGGVPAGIMMTGQRNPRLNEWLVRVRSMGGNRVLSDQGGLRATLRLLRQGSPIALLADQDSSRWPGIFVKFFGIDALTPEGPARIALTSGLPILPMALARRRDDPRRHILRIGQPIIPESKGTDPGELHRLTQAYTEFLEASIRLAPEQWVWVHRRWRHRPGQKIKHRGLRRQKGRETEAEFVP